MMFKIASVLLLALAEIVILAKSKDYEFMTVSTTQSPSQNQPVDDRLAKLEEKVEYYPKVAEANHRIEVLELQNKQLQQTLMNITDLYAEVTANTHHLEAIIELQNKQIQQILIKFVDVRTEVTANMQRLEAIEIHNKQMQMKLENVSSVVMKHGKRIQASYYGNIPLSCKEIQESGRNTSGFYRIKPSPPDESFIARCNMDTKEGGWTYILNRFDGSQDFYLNWVDYKEGFGNLSREFWLGLEHLYQLTDNQDNELLIELVDEDEKTVYAHYSAFNIGNESEGYKLKTLGSYSGNAGDSFRYHVGMKFSTKDQDQDVYPENCAILNSGAWWYRTCIKCQLTGRYLKGQLSPDDFSKGIHWSNFHGYKYSLKQVRMMTRPKD